MQKLLIKNLDVKINNKDILKDLSLTIKDGEIHVVMGPNGVGKSTLSKVIMGDPNYQIKKGDIFFKNQKITNLRPDERSKLGIFLSMQNPTPIEGVSNQDFLRTAISSKNNKNIGLYDFINKVEKNVEELKMSPEMIHRSLNVGFSGGEMKKNEVLQIKLLEPTFIMLDELDSGLDVDSLKIVCENIETYQKEHPETSILMITHYPKILDYIKPDYVHILIDGKIVTTGPYQLALEIAEQGYEKYKNKTKDINKENKDE